MASSLLAPNDILNVIPGQVICEGTVENTLKNRLSMRNYRFDKTEVYIPEMRDYMLVRWESPPENLGFFHSGKWADQDARTDSVTILARGEPSRWFWTNDIQVSHVYVSEFAIKGYTDLMVDGTPLPHQPDTIIRWLIDRPRS